MQNVWPGSLPAHQGDVDIHDVGAGVGFHMHLDGGVHAGFHSVALAPVHGHDYEPCG